MRVANESKYEHNSSKLKGRTVQQCESHSAEVQVALCGSVGVIVRDCMIVVLHLSVFVCFV